MKKSITPNQIKENNRNLIYQYIYKNKKVAQQDIAYDLRLSRPTVTANLADLEEDGMIRKSGQIKTEYVGRKAAAYMIVPDFRISIGIEILKTEVKMIAVNLYGEKINRFVYEISYTETDSYFSEVCRQILDFKDSIGATVDLLSRAWCPPTISLLSMEKSWKTQDFLLQPLPDTFLIHAPFSTMQTALPSPNYGFLRSLRMPFISP